MPSGVTSTGFSPKTFEDLLTDITTRANTPEYFGEQFPTDPSSAFHILAGIISASLKDQWDLSASVADQQNRDKAEGKYLNDLAALVGLSRSLAAGSNGNLLFTGAQGSVVPTQTPVRDGKGNTVLTQSVLTLNRSLCFKSTFSVSTLLSANTYTINVESDTWNYLSDATATKAEIASGFVSVIGVQDTYTATVGIDPETFVVTFNTDNNVLTTTNDDNLQLDSVSSLVNAVAINTGPTAFLAGTVTSLVSSTTGVVSVTNPADLSVGRLEETDPELRLRMSEREQSTGTATKPSIEAAATEITGVLSTLLVENTTLVVDGSGRPPKSYELYVEGGSEDDIAATVWRTKPAGIETTGTVSKIIIDGNGDQQEVKFSRFLQNFGWVRVTYQINSEEIFPSNGEDLIQLAVVETGNAMYRGEDLDPTKFYGNIYTKVQGIFITNIEVAATTLANDTPSYQTTRVAVPSTTALEFDITRVPVTT